MLLISYFQAPNLPRDEIPCRMRNGWIRASAGSRSSVGTG